MDTLDNPRSVHIVLLWYVGAVQQYAFCTAGVVFLCSSVFLFFCFFQSGLQSINAIKSLRCSMFQTQPTPELITLKKKKKKKAQLHVSCIPTLHAKCNGVG